MKIYTSLELTFILLDKTGKTRNDLEATQGGSMCGDVNIFLNNPDDLSEGEIEIMIAEATSRNKGIAQEALT